MSDTSHSLAQLSPAPTRRLLSTLLMLGLSVAFLMVALTGQVKNPTGLVLAFTLGVATLMVAWRSHQCRRMGLVLTKTGLVDSSGQMLVPLEQIASVDRGAFAFKPSNGFILRLHHKSTTAWVPGLWWRVGTRMGIGGVSQPAETRVMADRIGFLLAERT